MTNSNEELKVLDPVSVKTYIDTWVYGRVFEISQGHSARKPHFTIYSHGGFLMADLDRENETWVRGIHPSLIPDGFCLSKIEDSETQQSLSIENTSLRKELEAARNSLIDALKDQELKENTVCKATLSKLIESIIWDRNNSNRLVDELRHERNVLQRLNTERFDEINLLSPDAKRYQYLRSKSLETINEGGVFAGMTPENLILNSTDLDEAIDNEIVDEALLNAAMTLCSDLHDIEAAPKPEEG